MSNPNCRFCGKLLEGTQTKFCSKQCSNLSRSKTRISPKPPRTTCAICGKPLTGRQTQYCSKRCKIRDRDNFVTQKRRRIGRKRELISMQGGKCVRCGYNKNLAALSFHHLDPAEKAFEVDLRSLANRSRAAIEREVEKCILLCLRCHAEVHHRSEDMRLEAE